MSRIRELTNEELAHDIDWAQWELEEMQDEDRTAKWYIRQKALLNLVGVIEKELGRRQKIADQLEKFGSVNLVSEDPAQLSIWSFL